MRRGAGLLLARAGHQALVLERDRLQPAPDLELAAAAAFRPAAPQIAMTQAQASKVLKAAAGQASGFVKVVRASKGRYGVAHAATDAGELACGNKPHPMATVTEVSSELKDVSAAGMPTRVGTRPCRS